MWGSALRASGSTLSDDCIDLGYKEILRAVSVGILSIKSLGKAELGDKTMLDSMLPFLAQLEKSVSHGDPFRTAWGHAAEVASAAAQATSALTPKIGRARPLAERSIGTPDAGAVSFGLIVKSILDFILKIESKD